MPAAAPVDDPARWDMILVGDAGTLLFRYVRLPMVSEPWAP